MNVIEWLGVVGGATGIVGTLTSILWSRSDREEKRIGGIAVRSVEDSKKFVLAGEQAERDRSIDQRLHDVKDTVDGIDEKLDKILLSGLLDRRGGGR